MASSPKAETTERNWLAATLQHTTRLAQLGGRQCARRMLQVGAQMHEHKAKRLPWCTTDCGDRNS